MPEPTAQDSQNMQVFRDSAKSLATKAQAATDSREAKDFAQGALFLAEALVVLDPTRLAGGVHPQAQRVAQTGQDVARSVRAGLPPLTDRNHDGKIG